MKSLKFLKVKVIFKQLKYKLRSFIIKCFSSDEPYALTLFWYSTIGMDVHRFAKVAGH